MLRIITIFLICLKNIYHVKKCIVPNELIKQKAKSENPWKNQNYTENNTNEDGRTPDENGGPLKMRR